MLVDATTYRRLTGDNTSDVSAIGDALADAQNDVQNSLLRPGKLIEQGTVVETLRVYRGACFPSVQPVSAVIDPPGTTLDRGLVRGLGGIIQAGGGFITGYGAEDDLYGLDIVLTYTGGWTNVTVPHKVALAIARLGQLTLAGTSPVPVGARAVSTGDTRIDFAVAQTPDAPRQAILATLSGFRYRSLWP